MPNRLQKLPIIVYVPAVEGRPGRAAYCEGTTTVSSPSGLIFGSSATSYRNNSYQPSSDGVYGGANFPPAILHQLEQALGDNFTVGIRVPPFSQSGNRPTVHSTQVCYPAVPAIAPQPARYDQFDNMGWNAGARSIQQVPADGYFQCTLPDVITAIQVGFSVRQFEPRYSVMRHSMVARTTELTVVEGGITVFGPIAISGGETLQVRRRQGVVTYLVDDVEIYVSEHASTGERYGGAVLYSPSDYLDSPAIVSLAAAPIEFSAVLPAMRAAIGDEDFTLVRSAIPPLQFTATLSPVEAVSFSAEFPGLRAAIGDEDFTYVQAALPAIGFRAEAGIVEAIPNNMVGLMPPPRLNATLLVGQAIEFSVTLPPMVAAIAEDHFTYMRGTAALRIATSIVEPYMAEDEMDGSDVLAILDVATFESAVLLFAHESLEVSTPSATLVVVLELVAAESLSVADTGNLGAVVELIAREELAVANTMTAARSQALQYAVNYLTGALVTYRQFDFAGFARSARSTYAWRRDGLYKIGGTTDDGELIEALIDYSTTDFDDAHVKHLSTAYLGVRTDGQCYLRVTADEGRTRVYKVVGEKNVKRAQLAKGVTGRYWNVTLEIVDASFATVDSVEVEVGATQRRGFNRRDW